MSHPIVIADMARKKYEASEEYRIQQRLIAEQAKAEASDLAKAQRLVLAQKSKEIKVLAKRNASLAFKKLPQVERDRISTDNRNAKKQKSDQRQKTLRDAKRKVGDVVSDSDDEA